jgi:hypothetical protein
VNTGEELKRLSVMGDAELAREASDLERRARLARGVMCRRSQARAVAREIEAGMNDAGIPVYVDQYDPSSS